jgi:hypothetical protein
VKEKGLCNIMILAFIDLSLIVLFVVIILAAIIGWYLLKFAIWILLVIIIAILLLAGLDVLFGIISNLI